MLKLLSKLFVGVALMASMSWASAGLLFTSSCNGVSLQVQDTGGCILVNTWGSGSGVQSATLTVSHSFLDNLNGADFFLNNNFISSNTTECNSFTCPDASEVPETFDVTALLQAGGLLDQFFSVNIHDFGAFNDGANFSASLSVNVPEPGSMALVALALAGLGFARRQRAK